MLSRVADSLYSMSLLSGAGRKHRPSARRDHGPHARRRQRQRGGALAAPHGFAGQARRPDMERRLEFDGPRSGLRYINPAAVTFCINGARENARQVREELSSEQWQRLNRLFHQMHSQQAQTQFRSSINDALTAVVDGIHLFKGVSDTTMIHGQGWQFIRLGRYLERSYATATLLEVYQPDLFSSQEASTPATNISSWSAFFAAALLSRLIARSIPPTSLPIAFWSFCC